MDGIPKFRGKTETGGAYNNFRGYSLKWRGLINL